jgi:hypothetical protein
MTTAIEYPSATAVARVGDVCRVLVAHFQERYRWNNVALCKF